MDYTYKPVSTDSDALDKAADLFCTCFPKASQFTRAFLEWQYAANPDGSVIGMDAFAGDTLAATYVCLPAAIRLEGKPVKAMLSLNTATHPDHRGKGLFTKLANLTYDQAATAGVKAVFGVANQNSFPGFVTRLGFQNVGGLDARVGIGPFPSLDRERAKAAQFQRLWNGDRLRWRAQNPANQLKIEQTGGTLLVTGRTPYPGIDVKARILLDSEGFAEQRGGVPRLWLSLGTSLAGSGISLPVPERLKPSPLKLIYRNLEDSRHRLDMRSVLFSFIDFDPY